MDLVRQGDGCARDFIQRDPSIGRQCEQRVHHALSCLGAAVRHASHNQKLYAIACRACTCAWPHGHSGRSMFPPEHRSHCLTIPHRKATCLSGMERKRSVSCSSATLGGSSSLRSTSTALGRSDGFLCVSQRTSRAACTAHAFNNAVFDQGTCCYLTWLLTRRACYRSLQMHLRVCIFPAGGQCASGLQICQQHRSLHSCSSVFSKQQALPMINLTSRAVEQQSGRCTTVLRGLHTCRKRVP